MSIETLLARAGKAVTEAQVLFDEALYEGSISRAYYAMFYAAEALLLSQALSASTHKGVLTQLNKHFIKPGFLPEEYGRMIRRAAGKRQLADYADESIISKEEAKEVFADAQAFVDQVRAMLP